MTTLFRLSLNVSSTRLILGENGYAGKVIKTFGNFVIRGDPIVGLVIFIIIIVIQFIVITKGAERVSEVAARFTLDAMPGKQMAIDADLNAGLIDQDEAKERREQIQGQADFYGSMDGASKFVKGDAIAGIIITFINLIGGIIIGIVISQRSFKEVLEVYTLATVGDGLVSQLPALLISTSAGIISTRSAARGNLNKAIVGQLFSIYLVMFIGGGALLFLTLIPGLPKIPLMSIGGLLLFMGYKIYNEQQQVDELEEEQSQGEIEEEEHEITDYIFTDPIVVEFGYSLIPLADSEGENFLDKVVMIRRQCAIEMGIIVPQVRIKSNPMLKPNAYEIKLKGNKVGEGELLVDYYLAMNSGEASEDIEGIETVEPAFGMEAKWIKPENTEKADALGYTTVDPISVMSTHLTEIIKEYSYELLGRQEVHTLVDALKEKYPVLVEEVVPKVVSLGAVQKILCNLLEEKIPIKDLPTILEVIGDYAESISDTDELTELVRQRLKKAICEKFVYNNRMDVILISSDIEQVMNEVINQNTSLPPEDIQKIVKNIFNTYSNAANQGYRPIIATSPPLRRYIRRLIKQHGEDIDVLSVAEIDNTYDLEIVGKVSMN